jgi:hypothetical protein
VDWFDVLKIKITKQWWEIPHDDLTIDEELGSGAFGVVMKGYLTTREEGKNENCITCAVKMLKGIGNNGCYLHGCEICKH